MQRCLFIINSEYNSLEDSFSSVKTGAPSVRWQSWIRRLLILPGFCLIFVFHLCGIACFSCNHWKQVSFVKLYSSLRSCQGSKLPSSKSWVKNLIFLAANFVKYKGLSSISICLLKHYIAKEDKLGFQDLKKSLSFNQLK